MENAKQQLEERESSRDKQETKRQENTSREAQENMPGLVQQRKDLVDFLKAGGKSGITNDFGKQSFFDSGKKSAKVSVPESQQKHTDSAPPDKTDSSSQTTLSAKPLRLSELRAAQQKDKAQEPAAEQTDSSSKSVAKDSSVTGENKSQNQLSSSEVQQGPAAGQKIKSESAESKDASPKQYFMNRETFAHMQEMINQRRQLMNELKAGARSGVTGDFGRQEFFDSQDSMQHKTDNPSQTEASFDASFKVTPSTGEKPAWDSKSLSNLDGNTDIGPKIKSGLYEVRTGDSLTKIAKDSLSNKNPSSQEVLDRVMLIAKENNISNIKAINAGDKIRIPLDLKKLDPEFEESKVQLKGSVRKTELIHHDKAPGSIGKPAQDSHHNPTKSPAKKPHLHDGKQPAEAKSHLHDGKQPAESKPHEVRPGYKPPDLEKLQVRKEVLDQMDMLEIQSKILFDSYNFLKDVRDLGVHSGAISKMRSEEMRKAAEQSSLACSLKFVVTLGKTMNVLSEDAKKDLEKVIHQLETSDAKAFEQLAKLGEKGGKHVEDELSKLGEKESDNPIFKTLDKLLTPLPSASPETKALMESLKENFHQLIGGSYEEMKNGVASVIAEILVNNRRQKKSH